jgi:glycine cleavage system H protein
MSQIPNDLKYTKSHEWVRVESDGTLTVGITDHAQELMGDMVYVELPEAGRKVEANKECAVVESVKAASDVYAPVTGEVTAANSAIADSPETVNKEPYGAGWMFKMKAANKAEVEALLDAKAYEALLASEKH